jgi:hypothetical protein
MTMAVEPDSAGVRFPPPFVYLGALLLGLAAERFVILRSFGIHWWLLVATDAALRCRRGDDACDGGAVPAAGHQSSAVAASDPHGNDRSLSVDPQSHVSRNGAYLCRPCDRLRRADRPRFAPLVLITIQTQVIAREERYLAARFGDDYRLYKAEVRRWL